MHFVLGLPVNDATGKIGQVSSPGPTVSKDGKLLEAATGKIVIDGIGATASVANGFTFTAAGALRINAFVAALPAGVRYQNGLPFDTTGALCTDTSNPVAYVNSGIPFTSIGAVATA